MHVCACACACVLRVCEHVIYNYCSDSWMREYQPFRYACPAHCSCEVIHRCTGEVHKNYFRFVWNLCAFVWMVNALLLFNIYRPPPGVHWYYRNPCCTLSAGWCRCSRGWSHTISTFQWSHTCLNGAYIWTIHTACGAIVFPTEKPAKSHRMKYFLAWKDISQFTVGHCASCI